MIYTVGDIQRLLKTASPEERQQLAEILDCDLTDVKPASKQAKLLMEQFRWKYQTPLGYITREPSFDEICVDVAKTRLRGQGARIATHMANWPARSRDDRRSHAR